MHWHEDPTLMALYRDWLEGDVLANVKQHPMFDRFIEIGAGVMPVNSFKFPARLTQSYTAGITGLMPPHDRYYINHKVELSAWLLVRHSNVWPLSVKLIDVPVGRDREGMWAVSGMYQTKNYRPPSRGVSFAEEDYMVLWVDLKSSQALDVRLVLESKDALA